MLHPHYTSHIHHNDLNLIDWGAKSKDDVWKPLLYTFLSNIHSVIFPVLSEDSEVTLDFDMKRHGCRPANAKVAAGLLVLGGLLHLVVLWQQPGPQQHGCGFFIAFDEVAPLRGLRSRYRADSLWIKQAYGISRVEI